MDETFRSFLDRLRQAGELIDFHQPIDIRHIATLVDQSDKAIFFHKVIGYDIPVVSGIIRSRERDDDGDGRERISRYRGAAEERHRQADPAAARRDVRPRAKW